MKYAIIQSGGKQYRCVEGAAVEVDRLPVDAGATLEQAFEVAVPPGPAGELVTHIVFTARTEPAGDEQRFEMTFLRPSR